MVALTWEDIDFETHTVSINKAAAKTKKRGQIIKSTKTAAGNRVLILPKSCFVTLRAWKSEQRQLAMRLGSAWAGETGKNFDKNYVFIQLDSGRMMNLDTPGHRFKSILKRYNSTVKNEADRLPQIRLHDLRHTSASLLIAEKVDIAEVSRRMGHSDISVTLNIYTHPQPEKDSEAADALERMFDGPQTAAGSAETATEQHKQENVC